MPGCQQREALLAEATQLGMRGQPRNSLPKTSPSLDLDGGAMAELDGETTAAKGAAKELNSPGR